MSELVEEGGLSVRRLGGLGGPSVLSARAGGGHQLGINLEGVPLQGSLSQGFDLSLLPSFTLSGVSVQEGVLSGESGSQSAQITLMLPRLEPGASSRAQLAVSSERGAELGLWGGGAGHSGGVGGWLSAGGGPGDFTYRDRYDSLRRRSGAAYQRGSIGLIGSRTFGDYELRAFSALAALQRGEAGPEGQEGLGGDSEQLSLALSAKLNRRSSYEGASALARLTPEAQVYLHQRGYVYEERVPLWQSAGDQRYQTDTRDVGLRLGWMLWGSRSLEPPPSRSGVWSLSAQMQGSHELAELRAGETALGRYERARLSFTPTLRVGLKPPWGGALSLESAARLDLNTERGGLWVPSARLRVVPYAWASCEMRVSEAFRDPSFDERYLRGPGLIPNPELSPEVGWWTDLGCGLKLKRPRLRFKLIALLFHQEYERLILFIPLDPYRVQASDSEGASIRGGTLKGSGALILSAPWPVIQLEVNATLQEHALTSPPYTPLPLRPLYHGWGRVALLLRPSELWLKLTTRGPLYADRYGLRTLPEAERLDLGVSRRWRVEPERRLTLNASVRNALDSTNRDAVLRPLPGRSVWVSLTFEGG